MKKLPDTTAQVIIEFIQSTGIPVTFEPIDGETFLPGIRIAHGSLMIDSEKLLYPGDLLHEAGHIAVASPEDRGKMSDNVGAVVSKDQANGEEMMAIAWSYAACIHLGIDPAVVFHPAGYKGAAEWYIEQYNSGNMLYVPLLQWAGFCYDQNNASKNNTRPYPHMLKWLRG